MTVQRITATARTGGLPRDVTSVDVTRELPATGPASLPAGAGITAASGSLTLEDPNTTVTTHRGSPWYRDRGWPPAVNDAVDVDVTVNDGTPSRRFSGVVEDVSSSATGPVDVSIVDPIDRLHRPYQSEPIARRHVLSPVDGSPRVAEPLVRPEHHVTRAMRSLGFPVTAMPGASCALFVPMTGSIVPEDGMGSLVGAPQATAAWRPAPWGMGLDAYGSPIRWGIDAPLESAVLPNSWTVVWYVAPRRFLAGETVLTLRTYDTVAAAWVDVATVGVASPFPHDALTITVRWSTSSTPQSWTVPFNPDKPWVRVVGSVGTSGENAEVWHGHTLVWSGRPSMSSPTLGPVREVQQFGGGIISGSIYVGRGRSSPANLDVPPAGVLHGSTVLARNLTATPYIERTDALSFLREVARATLADMWIDRQGRLNWAGLGALTARPPAAELTATADLIDLVWEESSDHRRREVSVTCDAPVVTSLSSPTVLLWEGSSTTLEAAGDVSSSWATPASGVDWLGAVTPARVTSGTLTNRASYVGATRVTGSGESWATSSQVSTAVERINSQAFKVEHTLLAGGAGTGVSYQTRAPAGNLTDAGAPLPRIVGHGMIEWAPTTHVASRRGPDESADYQHETGPWVQGADCQALADWIGAWVTAPGAILRDLPIVYRDDLELGMVVDVVEDAVYHIRVRAVIVGMSESHEAGASTMTVTLRVLALDQQPATLHTYDQVWAPSATLAQRDTEWAGQTLAQFDANPLRRT